MKKDKIVLDRETYDKLCELKDRKYDYYIERYEQYQDRYCKEVDENKKLQKENGYLKALFDKEGDTQVIKYNGKLYRIVSTSHFHDVGEADTIDINAVCVSEVG
jgi:hypothetical protein